MTWPPGNWIGADIVHGAASVIAPLVVSAMGMTALALTVALLIGIA
jgi:hypothetical protein